MTTLLTDVQRADKMVKIACEHLDAFNSGDWERVRAGLTSDSQYDELGTERTIDGTTLNLGDNETSTIFTNPRDRGMLVDASTRDSIAEGVLAAVKRLYLLGKNDRPTGTFTFAELLAHELSVEQAGRVSPS